MSRTSGEPVLTASSAASDTTPSKVPRSVAEEPRRGPRARVRQLAIVDINFGDTATSDIGSLRVIGAEGAYVELYGDYRVGTVINVGFRLPTTDQSIACRAVVRSAAPGEGVGVEFLNLRRRDRARLNAFVTQAHNNTQ